MLWRIVLGACVMGIQEIIVSAAGDLGVPVFWLDPIVTVVWPGEGFGGIKRITALGRECGLWLPH